MKKLNWTVIVFGLLMVCAASSATHTVNPVTADVGQYPVNQANSIQANSTD